MKTLFSRIGKFIKWMLLALVAGSILLVLLFRYMPVYTSPLMFIRAFEQVSRGEQIRWHHSWVDLDSISPDLPLAVMSCEDQNFLNHSGFDWEAIKKVVEERQEGQRYRGGSTISQQTAKNVFLFPTSSTGKLAWARKGVEAYFTVLIEFFWDKHRIMEVYLNTIEMGDGIYGVKAVAELNFDKTPDRLTKRDAALIAATLPSPLTRDSKNPSGELLRRRNRIVQEMNYIKHVPFGCEEK